MYIGSRLIACHAFGCKPEHVVPRRRRSARLYADTLARHESDSDERAFHGPNLTLVFDLAMDTPDGGYLDQISCSPQQV